MFIVQICGKYLLIVVVKKIFLYFMNPKKSQLCHLPIHLVPVHRHNCHPLVFHPRVFSERTCFDVKILCMTGMA